MRFLVLLLLIPFAASAAAPDNDGFVWIDANTRIKMPAGTGASAPEKAPEKKDKKEEPKK
jgi:hypothetical protein